MCFKNWIAYGRTSFKVYGVCVCVCEGVVFTRKHFMLECWSIRAYTLYTKYYTCHSLDLL